MPVLNFAGTHWYLTECINHTLRVFTLTLQGIELTIRWRLREMMARQRMTNKRLADLMGVHPNAISRLKNQDNLPQIGGETLDALCKFLDCTPSDLIEYIPDAEREEE